MKAGIPENSVAARIRSSDGRNEGREKLSVCRQRFWLTVCYKRVKETLTRGRDAILARGALLFPFVPVLSCRSAAFSGRIRSMEGEIDDKLPSNSS
jgi:hypothetical protein